MQKKLVCTSDTSPFRVIWQKSYFRVKGRYPACSPANKKGRRNIRRPDNRRPIESVIKFDEERMLQACFFFAGKNPAPPYCAAKIPYFYQSTKLIFSIFR
jgi:hypothetical protein